MSGRSLTGVFSIYRQLATWNPGWILYTFKGISLGFHRLKSSLLTATATATATAAANATVTDTTTHTTYTTTVTGIATASITPTAAAFC